MDQSDVLADAPVDGSVSKGHPFLTQAVRLGCWANIERARGSTLGG
jgi:hypothetical protein